MENNVLDNTKVATIDQLRAKAPAIAHDAPAVRMSFFDLQGFELMQRAAKMLASSTLVPPQFQGNIANCVIAMNMAQRMGADPLMVCQNLYVVYGRPGWSAQFLIATFNHCGRFTAVRYEWFGERMKDTWGCRAWATEKDTGEKIVGPDITIKMAKDEEWYDKKGSKWKTIPQLMLMYRAAAWMIRSHAPEIAMGLQTVEELGDTYDATRGEEGDYRVTTEALRSAGDIIDATTGEVGSGAKGEAQKDSPAAGEAPTYAQVRVALESAKTEDARALAIDQIRAVADPAHRDELTKLAKLLADVPQ